MPVRVAVNGFGRIARMVVRALAESNRNDVELAAIAFRGSMKERMHLLKYDSVHGPMAADIALKGDIAKIGSLSTKLISEGDATKLPWRGMGIDVVLECTGSMNERNKAAVHLDSGADRVVVSAPAKEADITVVYGVNHKMMKPEHKVISAGSCSTNCLAPIAKVLNDLVPIRHGYMTTVHAYTNDQNLVDTLHKDMRRARAANLSMIPTSTGAAKAIGLVIPELKGKLDGFAVRVPTPNVSLIDFDVEVERPITEADINNAMIRAAKGPMKGVLSAVEEELVSIDFNHNTNSSCVDLTQTKVVDGTFVHLLSWYDNEFAFSNRMLDIAAYTAKLDAKHSDKAKEAPAEAKKKHALA